MQHYECIFFQSNMLGCYLIVVYVETKVYFCVKDFMLYEETFSISPIINFCVHNIFKLVCINSSHY